MLPRKTLLRLPVVCERVGYRRSKIYDLVKAGDFPKPVKLGARASAWVEDEVNAWIESRIRASTGQQVD
jgi:prophage regulatory protein